jgi:hypothetical protein
MPQYPLTQHNKKKKRKERKEQVGMKELGVVL